MTRRSSVRAQAREIYCEMAAKAAAQATVEASAPTPDPSPRCADARGGGEQGAVLAPAPTDLTARVRALYEDSSVSVREIARIAGVTEHTIYVRARKGGWKKRYRWGPRNDFASANRGRRHAPASGFAPAKGAGGRFIRRADAGKPYAAGLKAADADGHARGLAQCRAAEPLARAAQAKAEEVQRAEARLRAWAFINRALGKLADHVEEHKRRGVRQLPQDDPVAQALHREMDAGLDWLGSLDREAQEAQRGAMGTS